ncbi:MAG TPA: BREX system ATP-binding domain-containing protein [Gemmatimonadaceae bacterium]|jgi:DNA-binding CsgD family transcriptional regulator
MHLQHDVVCPTLIGRDEQLESLRRVLAHAREGNGRVALIVGEAGVGKSRLLRAMTEEARAAGFFVLQAACFEAERSIPYAPLLDLVRLFASSAPAAVVGHVLEPAAGDLVSMFPELKPLLPDATPSRSVDPESDRRRLFHVLAQAVTQLARKQPVFLSFEDVHWSDDATLELIFHLARSHATQPVVIVLTYRGEEAGPRLARLVADLERARVVTDLPLDRLGRVDVDAMLQAIFGPGQNLGTDFVHVLHGLTEGNPFFVEETLKSLILAGDLAPSGGGSWRARPLERVRVPRTAVEAVRRRLATLTVPARAVASMAAIAGRRFDFDLLQMLTRHNEAELLALVKELIAAQLVVEESAERFAFRHALTREAIYAELLARERVTLHREVAAALERQHADSIDAVVEALAYHAWESGDWQRAADYAVKAAHHALALSAPREAAAHLDRAFAALERSGNRPEVGLYLDRGRANETLGEFQRANDDFAVALARARDGGDARTEWKALHALGMLWAARDYTRAGSYRREALQAARTTGDESLVARSLNRVGNWYVNHEEPHAGLPYHQEALAIVERLADDAGVAETVDLVAMAHHIAGAEPEAAGHYARTVALFSARGDRRGLANALALLSLCGPSYHSSSTTPLTSASVDEELRNLRSVRLARDIGWRAGEAFVRFVTADCLMWRGDYARAIPLAREALALAREIEHLEWTAGSLRLLGAISLDLLDPAGACEQLEAAHTIARRLGSHVWIRWTAAPLAIARGRAGDTTRALELLESASRVAGGDSDVPTGPESPTLTLGERQLWLARAELALVAEEPERALAIVDARLDSERTANPTSQLGVPRLSLVRGEALTLLGRYDDAKAALDEARRAATAQGARPILWRIENAAGNLHRVQRQRLEARKAFDAARAIVDDLAARIPVEELRTSFRDRVESLIPSGPQPSPERSAKDALGGLTKRERDVAELVAQGKANRIIARELGIGERTVESYVTSALAKLDLTSRTQLAAWAIDKGVSVASAPRSKR